MEAVGGVMPLVAGCGAMPQDVDGVAIGAAIHVKRWLLHVAGGRGTWRREGVVHGKTAW